MRYFFINVFSFTLHCYIGFWRFKFIEMFTIYINYFLKIDYIE